MWFGGGGLLDQLYKVSKLSLYMSLTKWSKLCCRISNLCLGSLWLSLCQMSNDRWCSCSGSAWAQHDAAATPPSPGQGGGPRRRLGPAPGPLCPLPSPGAVPSLHKPLKDGAHKNKQTLSSEQDEENDNLKDMHFEFDNLWIFKLCSFLLNGISKSSCDYGTLYKMSQAWISNICKLTSQYLNKIEKEILLTTDIEIEMRMDIWTAFIVLNFNFFIHWLEYMFNKHCLSLTQLMSDKSCWKI